MSTSRIEANINDNNNRCIKKNSFYVKKNSGYIVEIDNCLVEPLIYQPTPAGAKILAEHYNKKYNINIQIIDHASVVDQGDSLNKRFAQLRKDFAISSLEEHKPIGILLMHGLQHVVPIVFSREKNINYMIIFDSTSGCRKNGYYAIANLFPECKVLLNNGTRQKDEGSCVADGISILKDALRLSQLGTALINNKNIPITDDIPCDGRPRRFAVPKLPGNFTLFRMPEELLKTAQATKFVDEANPDYQKIITKKNTTLSEKRIADKMIMNINNNFYDLNINHYLYKKSQKFAKLLDSHVKPSLR